MPLYVIPFPSFDPVLIDVGPLAIRWYALAYVVGILGAWLYARALVRSKKLWGGPAPLTAADFDDFVLCCAPAVFLGGRLGYVLFYNPLYFAAHPFEIVQPWTGGMSFHGALLFILLVEVAFARWRKIPFLSLTDIVSAGAPIGLFLGRLANFINGELWGRGTDVPWAMVFPDAGPSPRHPSQLYEAALEGLLLFAVLAFLIRAGALKRRGTITGAFAIGYGLARIFCEFFREPDEQLGFLWGGLTMGMLLTVPVVLVGIGILVVARRTGPARAPISK
jgi:phosphatidylglycerol---prolipoprotein diacylglyceryl transferase